MDVTVGILAGEGGDIFSFEVCSPTWFQNNRAQQPVFARHILFMNEFDKYAIKTTVERLVSEVSGRTWKEIA
jgi:hypothetical protein